MGYRHIKNLYADQTILMFKECYAMEKIHGTSASISISNNDLHFFSGGEKHEKFVELFDREALMQKFEEMELDNITFYGEAYGGKQQGMSHTYGKELRFIVFEVKIDDKWLDVPNAEMFAKNFGLEFVAYEKVSTDLAALDAERDRPSRQAKRNGILEDKKAEGVVLRPLIELTKNNGERIICKHKRADFSETKTPIPVDPSKQKVLFEAKLIAEEWVTPMRLSHVLDKLGNPSDMSQTGNVIKAMIEDVQRESEGFVAWNKDVEKAVGRKTVELYKAKVSKIEE